MALSLRERKKAGDVMADMEIEITADNTAEIIALAKDAVRVALEAVGLQAEGYAKRYAPVDTGRLRNSITHTTDDDSAYVGTNVEYAPYVEYGTSKTKQQAFIKPAVQNHINEYKDIFESYLRNTEG